MATEREFHEAIARSVSIMVYFHNERRTETNRAAMTSEVHIVAEWIMALPSSPDDMERRLFKAVDDELVARYNRSIANRLIADFLGAFRSVAPRPRSTQLVGDAIRV